MTKPTVLEPLGAQVAYRNIRGFLILLPWLIHLLFADVLLSALLPISFFLPKVSYNLSSLIASPVWRGIQLIFERLNGAQITTSGVTLPPNESAIVLANHVAWTDFYLIQHMAVQTGMLGRCRWFAKQQLKWVPFLGWGLWAMGMPLISRKWDRDRKELDMVFRGPKKYKLPIWLVSYSETTRYTPQKYTETVHWCKTNNKPVPKYTLYPRTRGFVTTVSELKDQSSITAIYDFTLAYAHGKRFFEVPSMWQTISEPRMDKDWKFHVHVRRFEIKDLVGKSQSELAVWLEQRWLEKSKILEDLQQKLEAGKQWEVTER